MHQNESVAHHPRQGKIDFTGESLWPSFPESWRLECQKLVIQLLTEVSTREREQHQGGVHERED